MSRVLCVGTRTWSRQVGELVLFSRSQVPARGLVAGESAAILFFTGVRYFRADEYTLPIPPSIEKRRRPARPRKSRRDVLIELHG